jgi:WD40 repeat protein
MKGPAVDAEVQRHELTGHAKALLAVRFSPGKLVTVDEDRVQLWTLPRSDQEKPQSHMVRHAGIKWAGVSPDGRWVAVADVKGAVATIDLRMLIPNQGVWSKLKGVNLGEVQAGAFSVEGRFLVIGDQQGQIQRWDLASRQALEPLQSDNPVEDLAVGPACQFIACKTEKNNLQIWEQTTKGKEVMERRAPFRLEKPARTMAFSPDGRWLAAATTARDDTSVRLMGLAKASASPLELPWNQRGPASSALSPDGAWLASVMDKGIDLFHLRGDTASEPQRLESNLAIGNQRIVFSPQDRWLVCAEPGRVLELGGALEPGRILVWRLARLEGQTAVVKDKKRGLPPDRIFKTDAYPDVSFSPDGRWMLVEGAELHVWNLEKGDPPVRLADGSDKIGPWAFDRGSRWLAAAGQATSIWSLAEDRVGPRVTLTDSKDKQGPVVGSLQFSPGGQWLTGHGFGWVKVWRPGAPTSIELPGGHDVQRLHGFASDRLLIGDTEKGVAVYSLREEGEQVPPKHVAISDRRGRRTVISPNGSLLAADILTVDGPWIYVMDLTSELPREPNIGEAKPGNVEPRSPFSPDGHWLVTVGDDKIARLWDLSKRALREPAYLLKDHLHLCFSPDSRWLLYGDQSKAVWLRDLSSPTLDPVLLPTTEWTGASLSFTGDGRFACTPCLGSIMRLWHVNVEELLPLARKAVGRELTAEERKQFDLPEPAPR